MKNQIFVVEGRNDVTKLKQVFPDINIVSVNGSAIDSDVVNYLANQQLTHEIILCMDPDFPGKKIRSELELLLDNPSHIFIERHKSFSKNRKKIGLEHLSTDDIKEAFNNIYKKNTNVSSDITLSYLHDNKLVGFKDSKRLRSEVSKKLNIGHTNGKLFLERVNKLGINKKDINIILEEIESP